MSRIVFFLLVWRNWIREGTVVAREGRREKIEWDMTGWIIMGGTGDRGVIIKGSKDL